MHITELATRWLGWFHTWLEAEDVRGYLDAGLQLVAGQPPGSEQSALLMYEAMWYIRQTHYVPLAERSELAARAVASAEEGLRIAEIVNDPCAIWVALDILGFVYDKLHRYREAHATQHRRQTLQQYIHSREEIYDLYQSMGWEHAQISDYPAAASWYGQAWQIAQTMESPALLLSCMVHRLSVWVQWDRWDEACEVAKSIVRMGQTSDQDLEGGYAQLEAHATLAELTYRMGKSSESEDWLNQYRQLLERRVIPKRPLLLSSLYAAHGDWKQALAYQREFAQLDEP